MLYHKKKADLKVGLYVCTFLESVEAGLQTRPR
jgi:hypothetical protein